MEFLLIWVALLGLVLSGAHRYVTGAWWWSDDMGVFDSRPTPPAPLPSRAPDRTWQAPPKALPKVLPGTPFRILPLNPPRSSELPAPPVPGARNVELILPKGPGGNFYSDGWINQRPARFMVDTGASYVTVPAWFAQSMGLSRGRPVRLSTANGVVTNFETFIDSLTVGPIRLRHLKGVLNPYASDRTVLLGMTALDQLKISHQGGRLVLQQPIDDLVIRKPVRDCMGEGKVVNAEALKCMEGL